jgi:hypothetical protein
LVMTGVGDGVWPIGVSVGLGDGVGVGDGVSVGPGGSVGVGDGESVTLIVGVGELVGVGESVTLIVGLGVSLGVSVGVAVGVSVGVGVGLGVGDGVSVGVAVGVLVGVGDGVGDGVGLGELVGVPVTSLQFREFVLLLKSVPSRSFAMTPRIPPVSAWKAVPTLMVKSTVPLPDLPAKSRVVSLDSTAAIYAASLPPEFPLIAPLFGER